MKLYRIRNKQTGQFLAECHTKSPVASKFNDSGVFWKRIDTVKKHLVELCTEYTWRNPDGTERGHKPGLRPQTYACWIEIVAFHKDRLKIYEVVVNNVTVNGEEIVPANKLIKGKIYGTTI